MLLFMAIKKTITSSDPLHWPQRAVEHHASSATSTTQTTIISSSLYNTNRSCTTAPQIPRQALHRGILVLPFQQHQQEPPVHARKLKCLRGLRRPRSSSSHTTPQCIQEMSRNNGKVGSKLQELRLSLSRSSRGAAAGGSSGAGTTHHHGVGVGRGGGSPRRLSSSSSSTASPPSSCVSSEGSPEAGGAGAGAPMILAGCPRCMMYVMLSREDPRCPKCYSTVLLDFNDAPNADPRHGHAGANKGRGGRRG